MLVKIVGPTMRTSPLEATSPRMVPFSGRVVLAMQV